MIRLLLIIPTKQSLTNMRRRFINKVQNATFNDYMFIEALYDNTHIYILGCSPTLMYKVGSDNWQIVGDVYFNYTLQYTGQKIFFKDVRAITPSGVGTFNANVGFKVGGDFRSLFLGDKVRETSPLIENCFHDMFYNSNLTDFYENILYYPRLAAGCYSRMFYGCSNLTTASQLPATTLADGCYYNMFSNCSSLTTAPELPATTLVDNCYMDMFNGCSKLNYIKMLATDISARDCLYNWVENVSPTGTFVKNPNMTSLPTGTDGIPEGWTVISNV